jgi:hypothetical protein
MCERGGTSILASYLPGWHTDPRFSRRYVLCYHRSGADYRSIADSNTGKHNNMGTEPDIASDLDIASNESLERDRMIFAVSAVMHRDQIAMRSDQGVIANIQIMTRANIRVRANIRPFAEIDISPRFVSVIDPDDHTAIQRRAMSEAESFVHRRLTPNLHCGIDQSPTLALPR